jgi:hypothetical protein
MENKPRPRIRAINRKVQHPRFDPPRPLSEWEREMLDMFTSVPFDGHDRLRQQIHHTRVEGECGCGCLTPHLVVEPNPEYRLTDDHRGPIYDLFAKDTDGMVIHALLFVGDGYMSMLEVQRGDGSPFKRPPDPIRFLDIAENLRHTRGDLTYRHLSDSEAEARVERERERLEEARRRFRKYDDYVVE